MRRLSALQVALVCVAATAPGQDVILRWSDVTLDAIRTDRTAPPNAARTLAMVHVAMFDAVNAIDPAYEAFMTDDFKATGGESVVAAAACAAHDVLAAAFPGQAGTFDSALAEDLAALPDDRAKSQGLALGQRVSAAMITARENDGAAATVGYAAGSAAGDWQPTPPAFAAALLPQWPTVTPFCLEDVASLRRAGPPPLTSAEYATAFNETKSLGSKTSTTRTEEQTQIAQFWVDGPGTATPPGHWFQIARDLATQRGTSLAENARLFALIGLAVCDAGICAWDNKYAYNDWRPVTAIRTADTDGNDATEADPTWEPLIATPPFPSYTSGHSTFSGAASKVLSLFLGSDEIPFTTTTDDLPGVTRSYSRFSQAANEAGRSRVYGGIHWEYDNQDGLASGRELAMFIFDNFLRARDAEVIEIPADDVLQCGPIGIFPFGGLAAGMAGMRLTRRRKHK